MLSKLCFQKGPFFSNARCISFFSPSRVQYNESKPGNQRYRKHLEFKARKKELLKSKVKSPVIEVPTPITVAELIEITDTSYDRVTGAIKLNFPSQRLNKKTVIEDFSTVCGIMKILGLRCKSKKKEVETVITDLDAYPSKPTTDKSRLSSRPPIVTIMGHIDHGKTTLLDALRETNVAQSEAGGITQAIGAFTVEVLQSRKITFLDTPGHAAFSAMRRRGAQVTDLVILVVAADDSVMEQTIESIKAIQLSNAHVIVAVNKCDSKKANPKKVYEDLAEHGVVVERLGGNVQSVEISALKKQGLNELIECVLLQADLLELAADNNHQVQGVVLESQNVQNLGSTATVVIQQGTMKKGQWLVAGTSIGKVKGMQNENNQTVKEALPGFPVQVFGWKQLPSAGDVVLQVEGEKRAKEVLNYRTKLQKKEKELLDLEVITAQREEIKKNYDEIRRSASNKLSQMYMLKESTERKFAKDTDTPELNVILKADVDGSLNVLIDVLETYDSDHRCALNIVDFEVGEVKKSDVERAALCNGTIYCFNQTPSKDVESLAETSQVKIVSNDVIYHLIDKLKQEITSLLPPQEKSEQIGEAEVRDIFKFSQKKITTYIAGCKVNEGILEKGGKFLLLRDDDVIFEGAAVSLRHVQTDVQSISKGNECGLVLESPAVPQKGDRIRCHRVFEVDAELDWNPPGF